MLNFMLFPIYLVFYEITTYLSNDMYLPALPVIMKDLQTTPHLSQLTLTTWFLGSASMQLFLGPISDRYGRRPVLFSGGVLFLVSTFICAITTSIHTLLISRFFQGASVCSVAIAGYAAIHELYDTESAIRILAFMTGITVLAPAFGPLAGGLILLVASWRAIFWLLGVWGLIALALLYKGMPETRTTSINGTINLKQVVNNYGSILRTKVFMTNTIVFCLLFGAMIAWIAVGPFLVLTTFGYSPIMFGILQALVFGCFILGGHVLKIGMKLFQINTLVAFGLILTLIGSLLNSLFAWWQPSGLIYSIISLMIFTFGSGLTFGPLNRLAIEASKAPMGCRMAIFSTAMGLFGVLGSAGVAWIYNGTLWSFSMILVASSALACLIRLV